MREQVTEFASIGDTIECEVQEPYRHKLRVILSTAEACAYGNELIASGRWKKAVGEQGDE